MDEKLLQFAWQNLLFDFRNLHTADGTRLSILHPGMLNRDQGPDFHSARIRIGYHEFHGDVEIHLDTDSWFRHRHHRDVRYNSVVLHVVLQGNGRPVLRADKTIIPEISLEGKLLPDLMQRWDGLKFSGESIPCAALLKQGIPPDAKSFISSLALRRIQEKSLQFRKKLKLSRKDWEQVIWEEIAASLSGPVNAAAFRAIASALPVKLIQKYAGIVLKSEAMLFGVAGLLTGLKPADEYSKALCKEWKYLSALHSLKPVFSPVRYFRMRPAAFPDLRLSQLAALASEFPVMIEMLAPGIHRRLLRRSIPASTYWKTHSRLGQPCKPRKAKLGKEILSTLLINTLLPLARNYFEAHGRAGLDSLIAQTLAAMQAEDNRISRLFASAGLRPENALGSQGSIHLKQKFCDQKLCLHCEIGQALLKGKGVGCSE